MNSYREVWERASDQEILERLPYMVKRIIEVLRYLDEDAFIESEPTSVLVALEVLRDRHAS